MWPFRDEFLNDFIDLLQLFHEVILRLQATSGIHDENITSPCRCRLDGVIDHRARIRARVLADNWYTNAIRPYLELINGRRAEGIGGGKHDTMTFPGEPVG